ncbi:MAG: hypothetical protein AAFR52_06815 [Pseudomonadota bacterium]
MMNDVKEGARLLMLAEAAEKHLQEHGHDVAVAANDELTAFDVTPSGTEERVVRVQAIGRESWEMVRPNGETLTGIGTEQTFLVMLERVVGSR